MKASSLRWRFF